MRLDDRLVGTGGIAAMARDLGVSEHQARVGAGALLPAILGGFQKQARPAGGLGGLLDQLGGGSLLDDVLSPAPTPVDRGNAALGRVFGSKDVSRAVAQHAAGKTGLDPRMLRRMLPIVMMLVSGYMAKKRRADAAGTQAETRAKRLEEREARREAQRQARRAGRPDAKADVDATPQSQAPAPAPTPDPDADVDEGGLGDWLKDIFGGKDGGATALLDAGDANPLDEILRQMKPPAA